MSNIMKYFGATPQELVKDAVNGSEGEDGVYLSQGGGAEQNDLMSVVNTGINLLLGVVGILAVIMIIVGGVSYTTSAGDAAKVKKAKDTILYGVVGLVIALLAFAIVNFILKNVFNS